MFSLKVIFVLVFTMRTGSAGNFEEWNTWSNCMKTCGPSIRVRFRKCAVEPCPPSEPVREVQPCQERPTCDGPWTTESETSTESAPSTELEYTTDITTETTSELSSEVDLVFLLDESISVSKHYVTLGKYFIRQFLQRSWESYENHIRYALCTFSSKLKIVFEYGDLDEPGMIDAVDGIRYKGGSTDIADTINQLAEGVLSKVRPKAKSVIVLISDGFFETEPVVPSGVITFAVAIGDNVNESILSRFALGTVFLVQFDSDVDTAVSDLLSAM